MDTINGNTPLAVGKSGDQAGAKLLRISDADLTQLQQELNRSAGRVSVCTGNEMRSRGQHMVDQRELQNAQKNHADLTARLAEATQRFFEQQAGALGITAVVTSTLTEQIGGVTTKTTATASHASDLSKLAGGSYNNPRNVPLDQGFGKPSDATRAAVDQLAAGGVDEFSVGTRVVLKSGGPVMTIDKIMPGGTVLCERQDGTRTTSHKFYLPTLRQATAEEIAAADHDANKPLTDEEREEAERQQRDAGKPAPDVTDPANPVRDDQPLADTVRKHIQDRAAAIERPVSTFNADQYPPDGFKKGDFFRFMSGDVAEHNGDDFGDPQPESAFLEIPADYQPPAKA